MQSNQEFMHDEQVDNDSGNRPFEKVLEAGMSRRTVLAGSLCGAVTTFFASSASALVGRTGATVAAAGDKGLVNFTPVAVADGNGPWPTISPDYQWEVLIPWGEPLQPGGPAYQWPPTAADQAQQIGIGHDGMTYFPLRGNITNPNGRGMLAINHEFGRNPHVLGKDNPESLEDVRVSQHAHGVSVVEIRQDRAGRWQVVKDSPFNRRITADTEMELTGPAAGHDLLKTAADPTGKRSLGTWNNCGNGRTPWGTYLACEENFNGYFSASDPDYKVTPEQKRYGIRTKDWGYGWGKYDERFDVSKHPNEPHRAGYVVEIDPLDPMSTPKKRTALGRFKHENAEVVVAADGRIVVYMGDDERGEYLYRFISEGTYAVGGDPSRLLDRGTLYAAKFNSDGSGKWLALTRETTGMGSEAEICIFTRMAASAVKATTMDRPEWVAAHPKKAEVYCALTNNKNRGKKPNAGGDATPVGGPNPREANKYGQIVRWRPADGVIP